MASALERPDLPARRRLDVDAYHRMAGAGILKPDDRVELIDGEIIDRAPIGSEHAGTTIRFNRLLAPAAASGIVTAAVRSPLRLDRHNEPEPDLMLLRPRADDYRSSLPTADDVLLLVEVADSSLAYDRTTKLALYARHGIPEVWLVDLVGRAVEICREPVGGYASRQRLRSGAATPILVPELAIDIGVLLD